MIYLPSSFKDDLLNFSSKSFKRLVKKATCSLEILEDAWWSKYNKKKRIIKDKDTGIRYNVSRIDKDVKTEIVISSINLLLI